MNDVRDEAQLRNRILKVLELQDAGTAEEIAFTIAEMQGVSTEEGNAEMILAVKEQAEKLVEEKRLEVVRSKHASNRYKRIAGGT